MFRGVSALEPEQAESRLSADFDPVTDNGQQARGQTLSTISWTSTIRCSVARIKETKKQLE